MDMNQSTIEQQRLDQARLEANGMYSSQFEKDACGMGFVVNIKGKKSHSIIDDGLRILERLEHRGGAGADKDTGMVPVFWYKFHMSSLSANAKCLASTCLPLVITA